MKKILFSLLFVSLPVFAAPFDVTLRHPCDTTQIVADSLLNKHNELPIVYSEIMGDNQQLIQITVWYNKDKRTVSVVQTSKTAKVSCIIAVGEQAEVVSIK
jgi:hypothetical protein